MLILYATFMSTPFGVTITALALMLFMIGFLEKTGKMEGV